VSLPRGFRAGAATAGFKVSGRPDLAVLTSLAPAAAAGATTGNLFAAPCVHRTRRLLAAGRPARAVIINSGNANCATGPAGVQADEEMARAAARALGVSPDEVYTASTGIIGRQLPVDRIHAGVAALGLDETEEALIAASRAIMTTDLVPKRAEAEVDGAKISGIAKGSGMIHPEMATLLAFVLTDARVDAAEWRSIVGEAVQATFNTITVDGDTSTNDLCLAGPVNSGRLAAAVTGVMAELAEAVARDGEGAKTLIRVHVRGAASTSQARLAARAIAGSNLFKAAVNGRDPNWGRILAAAGRSGARMDPERATCILQGVTLFAAGTPTAFDAAAVSRALDSGAVEVVVDLGVGTYWGAALGCDLTEEYVRINADYHT